MGIKEEEKKYMSLRQTTDTKYKYVILWINALILI